MNENNNDEKKEANSAKRESIASVILANTVKTIIQIYLFLEGGEGKEVDRTTKAVLIVLSAILLILASLIYLGL